MPAKPAEINSVSVGNIKVTYIPDGVALVSGPAVWPGSEEHWPSHPELLDGDGRVVASFGALLIETADRKILCDTGFGAAEVDVGLGPFIGGKLLDSLRQTGVDPSAIDTVVYTHLHFDHVGWTSVGGSLTFPKARHLVRAPEWEHWHGTDEMAGPNPDAVQVPLEERIEFIEDDGTIAPGVNVMATSGHTPGHASLIISSGSARALITGDVLGCPLQIQQPEMDFLFDMDQDAAKRTRELVLQELEKPGTITVAGHFPDLSYGRVVTGEGKRSYVMGN